MGIHQRASAASVRGRACARARALVDAASVAGERRVEVRDRAVERRSQRDDEQVPRGLEHGRAARVERRGLERDDARGRRRASVEPRRDGRRRRLRVLLEEDGRVVRRAAVRGVDGARGVGALLLGNKNARDHDERQQRDEHAQTAQPRTHFLAGVDVMLRGVTTQYPCCSTRRRPPARAQRSGFWLNLIL